MRCNNRRLHKRLHIDGHGGLLRQAAPENNTQDAPIAHRSGGTKEEI